MGKPGTEVGKSGQGQAMDRVVPRPRMLGKIRVHIYGAGCQVTVK